MIVTLGAHARQRPQVTMRRARVQVEWQAKKIQADSVTELHSALYEVFGGNEGLEAAQAVVAEGGKAVPPEERVRVMWTAMIKSMNTIGKNQLQIQQMILRSLKMYKARTSLRDLRYLRPLLRACRLIAQLLGWRAIVATLAQPRARALRWSREHEPAYIETHCNNRAPSRTRLRRRSTRPRPSRPRSSSRC